MKRITLYVGHYGSGKTTLAVNRAFDLVKKGLKTAIADLDVVNPYFRTQDSRDQLLAAGIRVIASQFAGSNVDAPALPDEAYALLQDRSLFSIIDVGGDDRGALALGRYTPEILLEGDYEMLFVVNCYRPQTHSAQDMLSVMREIENAAGLRCAAIVNCSNLGPETTPEDVLRSLAPVNELSALSGLPVRCTAVMKPLVSALQDSVKNLLAISQVIPTL